MYIYAGSVPVSWWRYKLHSEEFPKAWKVDVDSQAVAKDGIYFAVEANMMKPHNSRKHPILKRDKLEQILEDTLQALYFRNLMYRGVIKSSRINLEHAAEKIPQLLDLGNQRYRVHI
jgi:hypothetical protein